MAPVELETALLEHPGILDAAVIGISDDVGRELPKAFVVRTDDSVKEIDIINFIQGVYLFLYIPVIFTFYRQTT